MFLYLVLALLPFVVEFLVYAGGVNFQEKNRKRLFLLLYGLLLWAMIAFRHPMIGSTDTITYVNVWTQLRHMSFETFQMYAHNSSMDYGYLAVVWFLSHIIENPQVLLMISGAIFSFSICYFVYKNSDDLSLSLFMYVSLGLYTFMVQGLRQSVAISLCLLSVEFCKKRKFFRFLLFVALAFCFHKSALIFLVMYFIYGWKLNGRTLTILTPFAVALLVFARPLMGIANEIFGRDYENMAESGGYIAVLVYALTILSALLFGKRIKGNRNFAFFFYMTCIGFLLYIMRYFGAQAFERVSFYFMAGQLIVLPNLIQSADFTTRRFLKTFTVVLGLLLFAYRLSGSNLIPYRFFWQH